MEFKHMRTIDKVLYFIGFAAFITSLVFWRPGLVVGSFCLMAMAMIRSFLSYGHG